MADKDPRLSDTSKFPDPVYKETVLRSLFDGAKNHHVNGFHRIDRAHLVMLVETGILDRAIAARITEALVAIDQEVDPATLVYTGEVEDFFFLIETELKARIGVDVVGRHVTADVVPVVDTTGAGDAFNAGFIDAWLEGGSHLACLTAGIRSGSLAVQSPGGFDMSRAPT